MEAPADRPSGGSPCLGGDEGESISSKTSSASGDSRGDGDGDACSPRGSRSLCSARPTGLPVGPKLGLSCEPGGDGEDKKAGEVARGPGLRGLRVEMGLCSTGSPSRGEPSRPGDSGSAAAASNGLASADA